MKTLTAVVAAVLVAGTVACSQYTTATGPDTFRGCLQGDASKGFSLLSPTGDGSGADTKGQTLTYRVVPAGSDLDLSRFVNRTIEVTGAVSTDESKTGSMAAPVPDTVQGTGGAGSAGFTYANGTLTARSIRELEPTCAVRFAPDRDEPSR
jgi:hypothetical protein